MLHQSFSRTSFRVAVTQIPTGGLEGQAGGGFTVTAGYWAWAGVGEFLSSSRKVVLLVSNHGEMNQSLEMRIKRQSALDPTGYLVGGE